MKSSILEDQHPSIRRRTLSRFDTLIKNSIAQSFLTLIDQSKIHVNRTTLKQSQENIQMHYKKINSIIDSVDDHILRRLENHENQIFSIVKNEIQQMREQTRLIVEKLNQAIAEKNTEDEIWQLSNQLDYFKTQTYKLFQQNKKSREEIVTLRKLIREYEIQLENNDKVMQKLKKKQMKEKMIKYNFANTIKQKMKTSHHEDFITENQINVMLQINKNQKEKAKANVNAEPSLEKDSQIKIMQSKININLSDNKGNIKYNGKECEIISEKHSILSFNQNQWQQMNPPPNLKQVQSIDVFSSAKQQSPAKIMIDKKIQTEEKYLLYQNEEKFKPEKIFSNTSYIERQKPQPVQHSKQLNLLKSGFYVKAYNQKISRKQASASQNIKQSTKKDTFRHTRYMSNAFNRGKMKTQHIEGRGSTNKSSLK